MADGPDVRALRHLLSAEANGHRPTHCTGCPFAGVVPDFPDWVYCALLDPGATLEVNRADSPRCTADHWRERARAELDLLECDNALLAAVARDAREESLMYLRGKAEGAAAERERCARAVCDDCAAGDVPPHLDAAAGRWRHADAIRRGAGGDGPVASPAPAPLH